MQPILNKKVISVGYGRHFFEEGNLERERMLACAGVVQEHHIVIFTSQKDGLIEQKVGENLWLHPTNSHSRFLMVQGAYRIGKKLIKDKSEWIVTTQDPFEAGLVGYLLKKATGVSLNVQEHGDFFSTKHWSRESLMNRLRFQAGKYILSHTDSVRTVSQRIKKNMQEKLHITKPIKILSVAIDIKKFSEIHPETEKVRAQYKDKILIVSCARFVAQKNFPLMLAAFAGVLEKELQAHLLLIGKGQEEQKIKTLIHGLQLHDKVTILPWVDDVVPYIQAADIYALSSNYEGWGRVLIEAMAVGTPIVTTDVGAAGEVVKDGRHGIVVPVADKDAFTKGLSEIANNRPLREKMSENMRGDMQKYASPNLEEYARQWAWALQ